MQFIQTSIHPSIQMAVHDWLVSLLSFLIININSVTTWFFLEKLKLFLCSFAGFLLLDVKWVVKYAPLFILHLYFYFAGRNSYDPLLSGLDSPVT
jgi:hypothetical protein